MPATTYFKVSEPAIERWNFTWFEGKIDSLAFSFVLSCLLIHRHVDIDLSESSSRVDNLHQAESYMIVFLF